MVKSLLTSLSTSYRKISSSQLETKNRIVNSNGLFSILYAHLVRYGTPVSISYAWSFGSLLGFYFSLQLLTGFFLTSYYSPSTEEAFESVVQITQQVKYGSLVRYMHANGASMIFILLYLHVARGLYFRSYTYSKRWAWLTGLVIILLMMATAFIGYVLPWGQMSFWGVTVITSLLTVIPLIGSDIHVWLLGGFGVNPTTLERFYGLHIVLPLVIAALVVIHIFVVHKVGSTSGTQVKDDDKTGFHPYFSVKDVYGISVSLILYGYLVFFDPNLLGHTDNYIPANPMVTPLHIVPEWYFTPFYAILRAFPNKTAGAIAMILALVILGFIPFVHHLSVWTLTTITKPEGTEKINQINYVSKNVWPLVSTVYDIHKVCFWFFFFSFIILIYIGGQPAEEPYVFVSRLFTFFYFSFFFFVIPVLPFIDYSFVGSRDILKRVDNDVL